MAAEPEATRSILGSFGGARARVADQRRDGRRADTSMSNYTIHNGRSLGRAIEALASSLP